MSADTSQQLPLVINQAVRVERDAAVGWVVLTRPGQINAINDQIRQGVPEALMLLDKDPQVRVIVIRGEGERGFCAGADIKERRGVETSLQVRQRMQRARWIESLDQVAKPIIAAIHGYCMGGGLELALACDIRFASPNAIFALPETGLGLIPGGGGHAASFPGGGARPRAGYAALRRPDECR
jgi:enoyl-CoA hydratase